jgi:hypothetical protein
MKFYFVIFFLVALIPTNVLSHSGGTDSHGCHAGSQPYHCHNSKSDSESSINVGAWDINLGYQYHIEQTDLIPFIGASIGKSEEHGDTSFGANIGLKLQNGWYASYVTTSKSLQLGYGFVHISANSDYFGAGIRFPIGNTNNSKSSIYSGGNVLFSGDE